MVFTRLLKNLNVTLQSNWVALTPAIKLLDKQSKLLFINSLNSKIFRIINNLSLIPSSISVDG